MYHELAEIPVYTGAQFISKRNRGSRSEGGSPFLTVRVSSSVTDHVRNVKRSTTKHIFVSPATEEEFSTPSQDSADAVASVVSPSGRYLFVLREVAAGEGKKRFVELWEGDCLLHIHDVTSRHKAFYVDEYFGSFGFDKNETQIVYCAEANENDYEGKSNSNVRDQSFGKFSFTSPLGEKFAGKKLPALFVFRWTNVSSGSVSPKDFSNDEPKSSSVLRVDLKNWTETVHLLFGQAVMDESGQNIYATGYEYLQDSRFPGIIGCYNRHSAIWCLLIGNQDEDKGILTCTPVRLTPKDRSSRSPRYIHHDGKDLLVYLSHELGGPHHSCAELHVLDFSKMEDQVLVDTVWEPDLGAFPGLYVEQLPRSPFVTIGGRLYTLLHSVRTHFSTLYRVCIETGECLRIVDEKQERGQVFSWTLLGSDGDKRFLCSRSRIDVPNQLVLGEFSSEDVSNVRLRVIDKPYLSSRVCMALDRLAETTFSLPHKPHVESIVIELIDDAENTGREEKINPAIMVPHGGPHLASTNAFNPLYAALVLDHYTLYFPNYTGSLGYGLKYVKELIGKCGVVDVQDCIDTTMGLIRKGVIRNQIGFQFIFGGSHGGLIAAHLVGQYPTLFSAVAMRNPVINAGEQVATTDIPDWCYSEFGLKEAARLDSTGYAHLFRNSPMFRAQDILAPTLLLIGEDDKRVPPSQGRNFYHLLKGKGTPAELLCFPGQGHQLDGIESTRMVYESVKWWFAKYRH